MNHLLEDIFLMLDLYWDTKIRDPGSGGGPDFLEKNLDFQIGIDTKFEGGCPKFPNLVIF